jgi:hypothetical protein
MHWDFQQSDGFQDPSPDRPGSAILPLGLVHGRPGDTFSPPPGVVRITLRHPCNALRPHRPDDPMPAVTLRPGDKEIHR